MLNKSLATIFKSLQYFNEHITNDKDIPNCTEKHHKIKGTCMKVQNYKNHPSVFLKVPSRALNPHIQK